MKHTSNRTMFLTNKHIQLFLLFFISNLLCFGQLNNSDSSLFLSTSHLRKVSNEQKNVIRYFNENESVIYRLKKEPKLKLKGVIDEIKEDSVTIENKKLGINQFIYLASKSQKRENHFTSLMLVVAGAISTTSGIGLIVVGGTIAKIVGVTSTLVGTPLLIGGVTKYFRTNYLSATDGWVIETVRLGGIPN